LATGERFVHRSPAAEADSGGGGAGPAMAAACMPAEAGRRAGAKQSGDRVHTDRWPVASGGGGSRAAAGWAHPGRLSIGPALLRNRPASRARGHGDA